MQARVKYEEKLNKLVKNTNFYYQLLTKQLTAMAGMAKPLLNTQTRHKIKTNINIQHRYIKDRINYLVSCASKIAKVDNNLSSPLLDLPQNWMIKLQGISLIGKGYDTLSAELDKLEQLLKIHMVDVSNNIISNNITNIIPQKLSSSSTSSIMTSLPQQPRITLDSVTQTAALATTVRTESTSSASVSSSTITRRTPSSTVTVSSHPVPTTPIIGYLPPHNPYTDFATADDTTTSRKRKHSFDNEVATVRDDTDLDHYLSDISTESDRLRL